MSVWLCMPSARPPEEALPILNLWRERGYKIALLVDWNPPGCPLHSRTVRGDVMLTAGGKYAPAGDEYPGYAQSVNRLVSHVLKVDPDAQWIVAAGDDTEPDANHSAEEIARECELHFGAVAFGQETRVGGTFGVMQPTADRWGNHPEKTHPFKPRAQGPLCIQCGHPKDNHRHQSGAYIDRVAGSPWMGREFCLRVNQGKGPLWPEYFHMGCDEELQAVATRLGVFWQRPDLIHLHRHWGRGEGGKPVKAEAMPEFLKRANSVEEWTAYKRLFAERERLEFPGSEPL